MNFCELGDILTGLKGVLLVVPEVLAEVATVLGLVIPTLPTVGGGVANFPADSVNFSSTSVRNRSKSSSDVISFREDTRLLDHGVHTTESRPDELWAEGSGEATPETRYKEDAEPGDVEGVAKDCILPPLAEFDLSMFL